MTTFTGEVQLQIRVNTTYSGLNGRGFGPEVITHVV